MRLPKGRAVPDRIARAVSALEANVDAVEAYAASLPESLRLDDGRVLRLVSRGTHNVAYIARDGFKLVLSLDPSPHGLLRHASMSYRDRLPSWEDLRLVRAVVFDPDKDVIQVLPKRGEYVNVHRFCLHLFEAPAEWQGGWFV